MTTQQKRIGEAFRVRGAYYQGMDGLGDARPITQAIGAGLLSAGGVIAAIPGGQLPGAIVAAVGALTSLVGGLFKPDITKQQTTAIVNQIEAQVLKPNLSGWQALPADQKTSTMQAAFLEVFDTAWRNVQQACSNPSFGSAGQACISDRARGSCHWTMTGGTPGQPGNCGNWFTWFRDPIANDPNVIPDSFGSVGSSVSGAVTSLSSTLGISPMVLGLGLIGFGLWAASD